MLESLISKVAGRQARNLVKKEALAQVLSCEFCEIFKNTYFTEHLRVTATEYHIFPMITLTLKMFLPTWESRDDTNNPPKVLQKNHVHNFLEIIIIYMKFD